MGRSPLERCGHGGPDVLVEHPQRKEDALPFPILGEVDQEDHQNAEYTIAAPKLLRHQDRDDQRRDRQHIGQPARLGRFAGVLLHPAAQQQDR